MKFRHILLLLLTLISASAQKPTTLSFTTKITPETIQTLEVRGGQALTTNPSRVARHPKHLLHRNSSELKCYRG
jgi:hypothetical protein